MSLRSRLVALASASALAAAGLILPGSLPHASAAERKVTPATAASDGFTTSGSARFVVSRGGHTSPGAVELSGADAVLRHNPALLLADLKGVGYDFYRDPADTTSTVQQAALKIEARSPQGDFFNLIHEPYHAVNGLVDAGAEGEWQRIEAMAADARWWSTRYQGIAPCAQDNPCSWTALVARVNADATSAATLAVSSLSLESDWAGFVGQVDRLHVSTRPNPTGTLYDFEPANAGVVESSVVDQKTSVSSLWQIGSEGDGYANFVKRPPLGGEPTRGEGAVSLFHDDDPADADVHWTMLSTRRPYDLPIGDIENVSYGVYRTGPHTRDLLPHLGFGIRTTANQYASVVLLEDDRADVDRARDDQLIHVDALRSPTGDITGRVFHVNPATTVPGLIPGTQVTFDQVVVAAGADARIEELTLRIGSGETGTARTGVDYLQIAHRDGKVVAWDFESEQDRDEPATLPVLTIDADPTGRWHRDELGSGDARLVAGPAHVSRPTTNGAVELLTLSGADGAAVVSEALRNDPVGEIAGFRYSPWSDAATPGSVVPSLRIEVRTPAGLFDTIAFMPEVADLGGRNAAVELDTSGLARWSPHRAVWGPGFVPGGRYTWDEVVRAIDATARIDVLRVMVGTGEGRARGGVDTVSVVRHNGIDLTYDFALAQPGTVSEVAVTPDSAATEGWQPETTGNAQVAHVTGPRLANGEVPVGAGTVDLNLPGGDATASASVVNHAVRLTPLGDVADVGVRTFVGDTSGSASLPSLRLEIRTVPANGGIGDFATLIFDPHVAAPAFGEPIALGEYVDLTGLRDGAGGPVAAWRVHQAIGTLTPNTMYTWDEVLAGVGLDTYIEALRVKIGSGSTGLHRTGVDTVRLVGRSGAGTAWNFEPGSASGPSASHVAAPATTTTVTTPPTTTPPTTTPLPRIATSLELVPLEGDDITYDAVGDYSAVKVRVLDQYGDPVPGAQVRLEEYHGSRNVLLGSQRTNADGEAVIDPAPLRSDRVEKFVAGTQALLAFVANTAGQADLGNGPEPVVFTGSHDTATAVFRPLPG